jgi:hypothetical protein
MRIDLGNGDWADLSELNELRAPDRNAVNVATVITYDDDGRPMANAGLEAKRAYALARRVVKEWSLVGVPLPSKDPKAFDSLTLEQDTLLRKGLADHLALIDERTSPATPGTDPTSA